MPLVPPLPAVGQNPHIAFGLSRARILTAQASSAKTPLAPSSGQLPQNGSETVNGCPESTSAALDFCDATLMPDHRLQRLVFPFPFAPSCDFEASDRFAAEQTRYDPDSSALMLVHPSMTDNYIETQVAEHGFPGFKPYRFYSTTADVLECWFTDFMLERQIAIADRMRKNAQKGIGSHASGPGRETAPARNADMNPAGACQRKQFQLDFKQANSLR